MNRIGKIVVELNARVDFVLVKARTGRKLIVESNSTSREFENREFEAKCFPGDVQGGNALWGLVCVRSGCLEADGR